MSQIAKSAPLPEADRPHGSPSTTEIPPPPKRKKSLLGFVIPVAAGVLTCGIVAGILTRRREQSLLVRETQERKVAVFNVVRPSKTAVTSQISLPGNALAYMDTAIHARTNGYIKSWNFDIGARVKKGDLLAEIEAPDIDQQLEQARAILENAEAVLSLAEITDTRAKQLSKRDVISGQERDQANFDLGARRALVNSGRANVLRFEQIKSFQRVTAPFDGVITARSTDVGESIQSSDSSKGVELFHLTDHHILRVFFSVPEVYAMTVQNDDDVAINFDACPGETFTGKIVRNSSTIDSISHTLNVEADVENASMRLLPGGYVTVQLKIPGTRGAVTIPVNTLLFRTEGPSVAIVRGGKVAIVSVVIGQDLGNILEVTSGLKEGDAVVLNPPDSIVDGITAEIRPETHP